jgi:hypothetical protein
MLKQEKRSGSGHFHAVRFYEDPASLCRIVADFIGEGLGTSEPAIIIATPSHLAQIVTELNLRAFDIQTLQKRGDLFLLDANDLLSRFMVDGKPDSNRFNEAMTPVLTKACRGRGNCTIRAYGEMVDVLWKADHTVAAIRLETLWNKLAQTHDFALLCGYAMGNFYKDATQEEICRQHTHLVAESGEASTVN